MRALLVGTITCLLASPALATLETYNMTFMNSDGHIIGHGSYSYDDAISEDLYILPDSGSMPCNHATDTYNYCPYYATWNPLIDGGVSIDGVGIGSGASLYAQGMEQSNRAGDYYVDGQWFFGDDGSGVIELLMGAGGGGFFLSAIPGIFPDYPDGVILSGSVSTVRVVPLPATVFLFPVGVFLLGRNIRKKQRLASI